MTQLDLFSQEHLDLIENLALARIPHESEQIIKTQLFEIVDIARKNRYNNNTQQTQVVCLNCNEDKSLCRCNSPEYQEITLSYGLSVADSADKPPFFSKVTQQANPNFEFGVWHD